VCEAAKAAQHAKEFGSARIMLVVVRERSLVFEQSIMQFAHVAAEAVERGPGMPVIGGEMPWRITS
jgi:hypothetical protein